MDMFAFRDSYPNHPGFKGEPETSRAAAEDMKARAPTLRELALDTIARSNGLTADQVAARLGRSIIAIRPRLSELVNARLIRDTGERRLNTSGKSAAVWMVI